MNNNEKPSLKSKGMSVAIVICFVVVVSVVGAVVYNSYHRRATGSQLAKNNTITEETRTTNTNDIVLPQAEEDTSAENGSETGTNESAETQTETAAPAKQVYFDENSTLAWPASGSVILGYSMDKTVFFQTLEQYKYNPAMIIAGEAGEMIGASADGIVTNIEETAQTGVTVTLDMGNGYSAVYGQLKDVPLAIGDFVAQGQTVGYLSEPTKYYSVEGPNLYFGVTKDGEAKDPAVYME